MVASQNLSLPPNAYDAASVRSSTSTASNYPGSPSTLKHTPPQPAFASQPATFQSVNAFSRQGSTSAPMNARSPNDKLALDYLMQSRHSSRDAQSQRERTSSASLANPTLPMDPVVRTPTGPSFGVDASGNVLPFCSIPIRNTPSTCPLDTLLLDFLADRRKEALDGLPSADIIGPPYPSFTSLLNPNRRPYTHALSKIFTDMLSTFPDISTLPEQVAIL